MTGLNHNNSDIKDVGGLSAEQQNALWVSVKDLEMVIVLNPSSVSWVNKIGGVTTCKVSPHVAKWALPYAKRIRNAEQLFKADKVQEALTEFQEINRLIPNASIVLLNIGVCHAEMGNTSAAEEWLKRALHFAPMEQNSYIEHNLRELHS